VVLEPAKLDEKLMAAIVAHGVAAKIGDAAASATTVAGESHFGRPKKQVNKAEWDAWKDSKKGIEAIVALSESAMQGVLDALYEGNWTQRGTGITRASLPDDMALAVKNAKADLTILFKKVTGLVKQSDMAEHEKVAPFFETKGDTLVWNEENVIAWMDKQRDAGKRDYLAEAQALLAGEKDEIADELDL
jgi:hypothetical protein